MLEEVPFQAGAQIRLCCKRSLRNAICKLEYCLEKVVYMHLAADRAALPTSELERQISVRIFDNDTGNFSLLRYNKVSLVCEVVGKSLG